MDIAIFESTEPTTPTLSRSTKNLPDWPRSSPCRPCRVDIEGARINRVQLHHSVVPLGQELSSRVYVDEIQVEARAGSAVAVI
jgi:hypothetical protein